VSPRRGLFDFEPVVDPRFARKRPPAAARRRPAHPDGEAPRAAGVQHHVGTDGLYGENGATRIVPGSHRNPAFPPPEGGVGEVPAEMPRGSVLVYNGSLWHGGGANRTFPPNRIADELLRGVSSPAGNQQLGVPREARSDIPFKAPQGSSATVCHTASSATSTRRARGGFSEATMTAFALSIG
jgi:ectoine hydroxylase-related dioxygenase (phytanoyl-CoA dioxygenase family)